MPVYDRSLAAGHYGRSVGLFVNLRRLWGPARSMDQFTDRFTLDEAGRPPAYSQSDIQRGLSQ